MQPAIARPHRPVDRMEPLSPYERRMQQVVQGLISLCILGMVAFFHVPLLHAFGFLVP